MKKAMFILLLPLFAHAQWVDDMDQPAYQPRTIMGGHGSLFRISLQDFEQIYSSRWGESFGAFAGIRVFGAHYITFKYGHFEKNGKSGIHAPSGLDLKDARWQENWYKLGLRIHPQIEKKWGSYYGFGLGFYDVQEVEPLSVFQPIGENTSASESGGTGFYLELGIEYLLMKKGAAFFEIEIASGGSRGRSSFEAMSVGGWLFSVGIIAWPF